MINEQELAEAIDTITEGGKSLGISCEDVYREMLKSDGFAMELMDSIHTWNSYVDFVDKFNETARALLIQAEEAKEL